MFAFADWSVREILPIALRDCGSPGLAKEAEDLERVECLQSAKKANEFASDIAVALSVASNENLALHARLRIETAYQVAVHAYRSAAGGNVGYLSAGHAARAACTAALSDTVAKNVWSKCPEIIRRVASIGDKRPVEKVITPCELAAALDK